MLILYALFELLHWLKRKGLCIFSIASGPALVCSSTSASVTLLSTATHDGDSSSKEYIQASLSLVTESTEGQGSNLQDLQKKDRNCLEQKLILQALM